jgi:hypothetical protein
LIKNANKVRHLGKVDTRRRIGNGITARFGTSAYLGYWSPSA